MLTRILRALFTAHSRAVGVRTEIGIRTHADAIAAVRASLTPRERMRWLEYAANIRRTIR